MSAETLVIGAGIAGAFAAARLARAGRRVRVLEARERVGGRAFARPFAGTDENLEFGGAWITPWHHRLQREAARLSLAWRPRSPVTARRWWHAGALLDGPPAGEREAHARVIARIVADAKAQKMGAQETGAQRLELSFAGYVAALDPPPATRALLSAWWCLSGNGAWERVPASEFLASCGYHDGTPDGIMEAWSASLEGGMDRLVAGLLATGGIALELGAVVCALRQDDEGVTLNLADGRRFAGEAAVLTTGLNPLRHLHFDPPLSRQKERAIARGHEGAAFKVWAEVEGIAPGPLITGGGAGIEWLFAERGSARGTTYCVGFGLTSESFDPGDRRQVEAAVERFFPGARLVAHDWHDWVGDLFSLGAWVATPQDAPETVDPEGWQPEGRLAFASSDFAAENAGWFEGAAASGEAAAEALLRRL